MSNLPGGLPQLHPRFRLVEQARQDISKALSKACDEFDLTYGETISILAGEVANLAKYMVRHERHGKDSSKKGDEA